MGQSITDSGLDCEQVAASAYRVMQALAEFTIPWDQLSREGRAPWLALPTAAEKLLEDMQGAPWGPVAMELFRLWGKAAGGDWLRLAPNARLAWEAVARHLACLFNNDELEDLGLLEQSWKVWLNQRLSGITIGS